MSEPDFLCIGCQRSGTTTFYNVLENHPKIWLPPIKELHFFDFPEYSFEKRMKTLSRRRQRFEDRSSERSTSSKDEASRDFFVAYDRVVERKIFDLEGYRSLFASKAHFTSGDITPAFSALPDDRIALLAESLRITKVVLLVRNPIDRLWSHANKSMRDHNSNVTRDFSAFRSFCTSDKVMRRSVPSQIFKRWETHFGERIQFFFFDDLRDRPVEFFREACSFLEVPFDQLDIPEKQFMNKEAKRIKEDRPPEFTRFLFSILEEELEGCVEVFNGHAHRWVEEARLALK